LERPRRILFGVDRGGDHGTSPTAADVKPGLLDDDG
jgi:hypothetical protein